jgi:hypothetical protein
MPPGIWEAAREVILTASSENKMETAALQMASLLTVKPNCESGCFALPRILAGRTTKSDLI